MGHLKQWTEKAKAQNFKDVLKKSYTEAKFL